MTIHNPRGLSLGTLGERLDRPESVLAVADGHVFCSHRGRGVARIAPDGSVTVAGKPPPSAGGFTPNGIALERAGTFLIANIGDAGGIWRMAPDGALRLVTPTLNGSPWPPVNFIMVDERDRLWASVSTTRSPRHLAYRRDVRDGFLMRLDGDRWTVLAEGLHYANEFRIHPSGDHVYVSETFAQSVTRFPVRGDGSLGARERVATLPRGAFIDGLAFDCAGALWAAAIVSNALVRIDNGDIELVLAEPTPQWVDQVESALDAGLMGREHFDRTPAVFLRNISSIAFAGPQMTTILLGSLLGSAILTVAAPVAGARTAGWGYSPDHAPFIEIEADLQHRTKGDLPSED
jgi:sugar lactone lactonase YvrE